MASQRAALLALYCWGAEAAGPVEMPPVAAQDGAGAAILSGGPPLPAWMSARLGLIGWITGLDALLEGWLNLDPRRVFYGWLCLDLGGELVLILRGTQSFAEWAIDGEFLPQSVHPVKGDVETGFWSLFQTLEFRDLSGMDHPFCTGVARAVGPGAAITVTGHSLGAALATYAAETLATDEDARCAVRGRFIASPRPGDGVFSQWFGTVVPDHMVYAYAPDLVPRVPYGFGYAALANVATLPENPRVPDNPASNHHALHYAWLLDPDALDVLPEEERDAVLAGLKPS